MNAKWNKIVVAFVFLALLHLVLDTTPSFSRNYKTLLLIMDGIITMVFITDLVFKLQEAKDRYQESHDLRVYLNMEFFIDGLSVLPFFMSILFNGFEYLAVLRLFRLMRVFKLFNLVKSHALIINAMRNKKHELYISMQVVILITIILSAILYFVENPSQPENFSSITDAFLWSISKYIGEIGGYGDFAPITAMGKILATLVGILGIAIFAVPAGIIASGFVEEIESIKKSDEQELYFNRLTSAFNVEVSVPHIREKNKLKLQHIRRKSITFNMVKYRLNIPESIVLSIAEKGINVRLRTYSREGKDHTVVEYFDDNSAYGTFINRNSPITIISTHSKDQPYLGHYSYAISEFLEANYMSIEKFAAIDFDPEKMIDFAVNNAYLDEKGPDALEQFKKDLQSLQSSCKTAILLRAASSGFENFEVLNGGSPKTEFFSENGTFTETEKLQLFKSTLQNTADEAQFTVCFQTRLKNNEENNLARFIKDKLTIDTLQIHTGADLLYGEPDVYYKAIGVLAQSIKNSFLQNEN